ncbi:hypothetical protein D3C84_208790 [compost metagenome]
MQRLPLAEALGRQPQRRRTSERQAGGALALGQLRQPGQPAGIVLRFGLGDGAEAH